MSIPLNVPDLSKLAAVPPRVAVGITWDDGSTTKFEIEDIQKFSEDEFRLFMLCLFAGQVHDERFVAAFGPKRELEP